MKPVFPQQSFETSSNIKFHEYPSIVYEAIPGGQIDRHDKAAAFCNFANLQKDHLHRESNPASTNVQPAV
jgi:hypothetical protein